MVRQKWWLISKVEGTNQTMVLRKFIDQYNPQKHGIGAFDDSGVAP